MNHPPREAGRYMASGASLKFIAGKAMLGSHPFGVCSIHVTLELLLRTHAPNLIPKHLNYPRSSDYLINTILTAPPAYSRFPAAQPSDKETSSRPATSAPRTHTRPRGWSSSLKSSPQPGLLNKPMPPKDPTPLDCSSLRSAVDSSCPPKLGRATAGGAFPASRPHGRLANKCAGASPMFLRGVKGSIQDSCKLAAYSCEIHSHRYCSNALPSQTPGGIFHLVPK